jgi:hypothetical protein
MARRFPSFGWLALLAVIGAIVTTPRQTCAQALNEGWSKLQEKFRLVSGRARGFVKGSEPLDPRDKSHVETIDLLAKTYTYGVYLRKLDTKPDSIRKDYEEFERDADSVLKLRSTQAVQPVVEVFSNQICTHALEVIQLRDALPIHKLHNARVLAKTAELGQAPLADTLVKVLNDPQQNEGVHYYMLKGLAALIPQLQPAQQAKCAEALVQFLEQKKGPSQKAPIEEIDGFRYMRREAIRALAKIHTPAISDKVRPALVLARFAGNDVSIQPPPRIDERIEAAIGLARMQAPPNDKQYQADYAAGQIAKCLGSMALLAKGERANRAARTYPWAILGSQLKDALETLKKNSGKDNKYVAKITDDGARLLDKVIQGRDINPNEQTWFSSKESDPPSKQLFQGSADSTVTPAPQVEEPEK